MRDDYPAAIRGAAALQQALDVIGTPAEDGGDKKLAQIIVDNEENLQTLVRHVLNSISQEL